MDEYEGMRKFGREVDEIAGKMRERRASFEVEKMKRGPDGRQSASRERGMTGIERLRGVAGFWRENRLDDIVEQIEREQGGRVSRMRVLAVVTEMERHVSGVEGAEDSPVARWARELREALGGDGRDPAADVSVSAYDLLPEEDREAIAWVREHGGLGAVKRRWECLSYYADPVPRVCMERRLARRQRQIDECHAALRRRNQRIEELGQRVGDLMTENAELRRRAMPEGYEWPRYESGEPLRYEDRYVYDGRECEVWHVDFDSYGEPTILNKDGTRFHPDKGERVKRPAPAVLAADSWDALWDDIEDCAVGYESFMRRCRALAERERGE